MNNMNSSAVPDFPSILIFASFIWSIIWKGVALWNAATHKQRNWFIAILVINTVGILEIVYLFGFAKKKMVLKDLLFWKTKQ